MTMYNVIEFRIFENILRSENKMQPYKLFITFLIQILIVSQFFKNICYSLKYYKNESFPLVIK